MKKIKPEKTIFTHAEPATEADEWGPSQPRRLTALTAAPPGFDR